MKYLVAVALLDGAVGPAQLETDRVRRDDVQELMTRVRVSPAADLTAAYPDRTPVRVQVATRDGGEFDRQQLDFEGSPTQPLSWERVAEKFHWLAEPFCDASLREDIIAAVDNLDDIKVRELTSLLSAVQPTPRHPRIRHRL